MTPLEIEVKFYVEDLEKIRQIIINSGAEKSKKHFELNICFEDSENSLIKKSSLLRLRKDSKNRLTFKLKPDDHDDNNNNNNTQFKIMKELEVEVSSFSLMKQILEYLGFHEKQIYEKYREIFILQNTQICLDTMPFGNFIEIEGSKEKIIELSSKFGLKWEKRILNNYLEMFEYLKNKLSLSFNDLSFKNFKSVNLDLPDLDIKTFLACFEAENKHFHSK